MPRRIRALALEPVLVLAVLAATAASGLAQTTFPRMTMPGVIHGDGTPYLDSSGALNLPVIDAVSRFEQVVLDVSPVTEYHPEIIAALRQRNPGIQMLAYAPAENIWEVDAADSLVHFPTRYNHLVRNLGGFLYDRQGNKFANYDINLAKVDAGGHYVVADSIAQLFYDVVGGSGIWNGMFVDVFCDDISWDETPSDSIDFVRAGYATHAAFLAAYKAGTDTLASRLRQLFGPDFILVGNCGLGSKYTWFNGWTREDFPNQEGGTWQTNMFRDPGGILVDEARFTPPTANQVGSMWDGTDPYDATSLRKLRFGLGTCSLVSALSQMCVVGRDATSLPTEQWWYDEYAVDVVTGQAMGDLAHTHWLGQAAGPAYQMIWVGTNPDACGNPGFETDLSGWTFGRFAPASATVARDTTSAAVGRASAHVTITAPGVYPWDVNLTSTGSIAMYPGTNYSATFWARASSTRVVPVVATLSAGGQLASRNVTIGTGWMQYQVVLQPGAMGTAMLEFFLGQQAGEVWFDDVHLQQGETSLWRRDFDHGTVLVNPGQTTLTVPLGATYRHILGVVDPVTNDGSSVTSVSVGASDAMFLIGAPRDTIPPAPITDARVKP